MVWTTGSAAAVLEQSSEDRPADFFVCGARLDLRIVPRGFGDSN
jgi:hypothetical protein